MPVIRTYIATPKGVLIPGIHNIFYAGYKNIICSSRRCSYTRHPQYILCRLQEHYMQFPTMFLYPASTIYFMPVTRTLYAVPDDVPITGIHCTMKKVSPTKKEAHHLIVLCIFRYLSRKGRSYIIQVKLMCVCVKLY